MVQRQILSHDEKIGLVKALIELFKDGTQTGKKVKLLVVSAICAAYGVSPVDVFPGDLFTLPLGIVDDAGAAIYLGRAIRNAARYYQGVWAQRHEEAERRRQAEMDAWRHRQWQQRAWEPPDATPRRYNY